MRWSRFAIAGFLVLGLTLVGTAGGDTEKDIAKKLVGKWELTKSSEKKGIPPGATIQFTKDGKLKFHLKFGDKDFDFGGSYKLDGKKLTVTIEFMPGKEKTDTVTIEKLTDKELHIKDDKGKVDEFKRVTKKKE
jgi:uncharacterized protein (TIGR03066 family)